MIIIKLVHLPCPHRHTHRLKAVGLVRGDNPNRLYNAQNQKVGPT